MKYILKNLKNFIKNETGIFILVVLCIISSAVILNFSYGIYQNYSVLKEEEGQELDYFDIDFKNRDNKEPEFVSKKALIECLMALDNKTLESISEYQVGEVLFTKEESGSWGNFFQAFEIKDGKIITSETIGRSIKNSVNSGRFWTKEEEESGAAVALVKPENHYINFDYALINYDAEKKTFTLQGKEYDVIGVSSIAGEPYIPFLSLDDNTRMALCQMHFKKTITQSVYMDIKNTFEGYFGDLAQLPELNIPSANTYYFYNTIIIISILIALISAFNFCILYRYVLIKRQKSIAIFRICGCSKGKIIMIFVSECMLMSIPIFLISTLCYDKFLLPLFENILPYMAPAYSIKLYAFIFGIYTLISFTVILIMLLNMIKKQVVKTLKEGKA